MRQNRRKIIIGNWKLNGDTQFVGDLLGELISSWSGVHEAEVVVCPPFVHLHQAYTEYLAQSNIGLGAQDVSQFEGGAYTGDISAEMLQDIGCQYVIIGHSERRTHHKETDGQIARKFEVAHNAQLKPILCVGETLEQRENNQTLQVIKEQLGAVVDFCGVEKLLRGVIAYEPVWAIGTGRTATPEQAQEVHAFIRELFGDKGSLARIAYGGSVKPDNAASLFAQPDIDGMLVGGASLKADSFLDICRAAELG